MTQARKNFRRMAPAVDREFRQAIYGGKESYQGLSDKKIDKITVSEAEGAVAALTDLGALGAPKVQDYISAQYDAIKKTEKIDYLLQEQTERLQKRIEELRSQYLKLDNLKPALELKREEVDRATQKRREMIKQHMTQYTNELKYHLNNVTVHLQNTQNQLSDNLEEMADLETAIASLCSDVGVRDAKHAYEVLAGDDFIGRDPVDFFGRNDMLVHGPQEFYQEMQRSHRGENTTTKFATLESVHDALVKENGITESDQEAIDEYLDVFERDHQQPEQNEQNEQNDQDNEVHHANGMLRTKTPAGRDVVSVEAEVDQIVADIAGVSIGDTHPEHERDLEGSEDHDGANLLFIGQNGHVSDMHMVSPYRRSASNSSGATITQGQSIFNDDEDDDDFPLMHESGGSGSANVQNGGYEVMASAYSGGNSGNGYYVYSGVNGLQSTGFYDADGDWNGPGNGPATYGVAAQNANNIINGMTPAYHHPGGYVNGGSGNGRGAQYGGYTVQQNPNALLQIPRALQNGTISSNGSAPGVYPRVGLPVFYAPGRYSSAPSAATQGNVYGGTNVVAGGNPYGNNNNGVAHFQYDISVQNPNNGDVNIEAIFGLHNVAAQLQRQAAGDAHQHPQN